MPKAKTHDAAEAKKLQETLTHPLELPEPTEQSDEECEQLQQSNNNNVVQEKLPVAVPEPQQEQHQENEQQHEEKDQKPSTDLQNGNKSVENIPEIVQSEDPSESRREGDGIVQEQLPPGKVVRRKKSNTQPPNNGETTSNNNNNIHVKRASVAKMEGLGAYLDVNSSIMSSSTEVEGVYINILYVESV